MNKSLTYRPEIDGLRAIAVICIILFHAGLNTFQGGFLGVDIFFVISGYLITKIIHLDLSNNEFKFSQFYKRRIGRILPALLFMVIGTYLASWILFLPGPHKIVGQYAITSLLSGSNILLHIKSQDYFGLENSGNPLFHTWSLGVEEQFYAIVPILMAIGYKFGFKSREVGITIFLTSITIYFIAKNNQTFNFYMMPTRAWELSLGMIAATITNPLKNKNLWTTIGFIFVFLSLAFANKNSEFIFLYILFATVGTSLLLINCHQNNGIGRALSIKPLSIIGKWSYSLYLWHIPLSVFIF
jgi:peptidoglycan/LPS O-acetylase OafA/YrhL